MISKKDFYKQLKRLYNILTFNSVGDLIILYHSKQKIPFYLTEIHIVEDVFVFIFNKEGEHIEIEYCTSGPTIDNYIPNLYKYSKVNNYLKEVNDIITDLLLKYL